MWVNWKFYKKMSTRDYEGWRRYGEWIKKNHKNYQKQMSDREIMNAKRGITNPPQLKNIDQMPDQKWHRRISFIKSGIRIVGYVFIPFNLVAATTLLVVSEVVGIVEELV
jgi:hypothetical protein